MQFHVGDVVVHPAHGVGQVVGLEEKRLFGEDARLYFQITTQKSTVWVPVDDHETSGIRSLTSKSELAQYRRVLKSSPAVLDADHRQRHLQIAERLNQGSFKILCELVRDLTARGWHKPLSEADATSLRRARDALLDEWAAAAGVSQTEATQEVDALLVEARQAYE